MADSQPIMTPERREQARQYRRIRYRLQLISMALFAGFLLVMIFGGSLWLWERLPSPVPFVVGLLLLQGVVELPAEWYGFRLAHRFGLTVQSSGGWLADQIKGLLLSLVMTGGGALLVLWLWRANPGAWHLWTAGGAVAFVLLFMFIAPVVIMPLFHKYTPLQDGELTGRLMRLSERAGVRVRGVFVSDQSKKQTTLNAALTGIGATRRIILFDTMIEACTPDEVEVILGHEMGHHYHGHIWKIVVLMSGFLTVLFVVAGYAVEPLSLALGMGGLTAPALPLLLLLYVGIGLPLLPLYRAISRQWERDCDSFALKLTGNAAAFITAFRKLADRNMADLEPPRWVYYFQYSHPPVPERVAMAERFAAGAR